MDYNSTYVVGLLWGLMKYWLSPGHKENFSSNYYLLYSIVYYLFIIFIIIYYHY